MSEHVGRHTERDTERETHTHTDAGRDPDRDKGRDTKRLPNEGAKLQQMVDTTPHDTTAEIKNKPNQMPPPSTQTCLEHVGEDALVGHAEHGVANSLG